MNLLAEFYSQPLIHTLTTDQPLYALIPRLWPFLRHTNPLVRAAALRMLEKLVQFLTHVLPDAMAHVYQTILVDEREDIRAVHSLLYLFLFLSSYCLISQYLCH